MNKLHSTADLDRLAARHGRIMLNRFFPRPEALFLLPDEMICSRNDFEADFGYATTFGDGRLLFARKDAGGFGRLRPMLELILQRCISVYDENGLQGFSDNPDDFIHAAMRIAVSVRLCMHPHTAFRLMRHIADWQRRGGMDFADSVVTRLLAYVLLMRSEWKEAVGLFADDLLTRLRGELTQGGDEADLDFLAIADGVKQMVRDAQPGDLPLAPTPAHAERLEPSTIRHLLRNAAPDDLRFLTNLFRSEQEQLAFVSRMRRAVKDAAGLSAPQPGDGNALSGTDDTAVPGPGEAEEWLRTLDRVEEMCRGHLLTPHTLTPVETGNGGPQDAGRPDPDPATADGTEGPAAGHAEATLTAGADDGNDDIDQGSLWVMQAIKATRRDSHVGRHMRQIHVGYIYKLVDDVNRSGNAQWRARFPQMPQYKNCNEFVRMMRQARLPDCPSNDSVQRGFNRLGGSFPDWRSFQPKALGQAELNLAVNIARVFADAYHRLASGADV